MKPMAVDPEWWKTLFDDIYLITDARSVCDEEITRRETDLICDLVPMRSGHRIIDLCGGHGRHCFELHARGFSGCTLVDYSETLTVKARRRAEQLGAALEVVQADARDTGLPSSAFDHALILGNSLGYIQEPEADHHILSEVFRLLKDKGWLLVDVTDGRAVRKAFAPLAWHEIGEDTVVCRERVLESDRVCAREMVLSKQAGLIRDRTYAIRLYDERSLAVLLKSAGFQSVVVRTDFSPHSAAGDYGFMNARMIAVGRKPAAAG